MLRNKKQGDKREHINHSIVEMYPLALICANHREKNYKEVILVQPSLSLEEIHFVGCRMNWVSQNTTFVK